MDMMESSISFAREMGGGGNCKIWRGMPSRIFLKLGIGVDFEKFPVICEN